MYTNGKVSMNSNRMSIFGMINIILLFLFGFIALYPFWNIFVYAFNDGLDSLRAPIYIIPRIFTFDNVLIAFKENGIWNSFKISIMRTVVGTVCSLICTSSMAYAMTKRMIPGYKILSYYFFITFIFGGGMIPYFLLLREVKLYNTFWVYIIPVLYNYWYMVIFRSFFDTIPNSIEESAQIDGSSYISNFLRLIMPLSKPAFAAIALFTAIGHWNDWFVGEFYVKSDSLVPLQTLLQRIMLKSDMTNLISSGLLASNLTRNITPYSIRMAIVVITVTPIILIYPFLQKYFIKGIMLGAVKG